MDRLAQIGLLVGVTWGAAGIVGYPGVKWKQGAILAAVCLAWLISRDDMPSPELIEGVAFLIFFALTIAREKLCPTAVEEKAKEK